MKHNEMGSGHPFTPLGTEIQSCSELHSSLCAATHHMLGSHLLRRGEGLVLNTQTHVLAACRGGLRRAGLGSSVYFPKGGGLS